MFSKSPSWMVQSEGNIKRQKLSNEELNILLSDQDDWMDYMSDNIVSEADALGNLPSKDFTRNSTNIDLNHEKKPSLATRAKSLSGAIPIQVTSSRIPFPFKTEPDENQKLYEDKHRIANGMPIETPKTSHKILNSITNMKQELGITQSIPLSNSDTGDTKTETYNNVGNETKVNTNTSTDGVSGNLTLDDSSLEVINEQKKVKYDQKFTLMTQAPTFTDMEDLNKLHLPDNTKIKIPIRLSREQESIIELAQRGLNIFYTGSAGTGKSVLLRELIKSLKRKYGSEEVAVTASTGLAACNIGGITVHSFSGIGLGKGDANQLFKKVRRSKKHSKRWATIKALVIDEISMLDGHLLDKLDFIAKKIRKNHGPFGGIQLVFCGDFFQLPPVSKDPQNPTVFAFESNAWKTGIQTTIMLQKVFRQQGDIKFIDMLNKMRLGKIDDETEREFRKLSRSLPNDEIIPAELYSTRAEVDRANFSRLNKLPGMVRTFDAMDGGSLEDKEMKERLLQNFLAPKTLQLKVGAQVMMLKNVDATLVNGSLGKIIEFVDPETYMFYQTLKENPDISPADAERLRRNPDLLRSAWEEENDTDSAVRQKSTKEAFCKTTQKEGNTPLDESIFDFLKDESGENKDLQGNISRKKQLLQDIHNSSSGRKLPLVRFKTSDLATRTVLVEPECWEIEDENSKPIVSRVQLPLMLAWSLSIHKSQGQTLPKVKVDLRRVFEKGQAYVALSRAVSRDGLQVLNFDRSKIFAHEKVVDFYMTLVSAEVVMKKLENQPIVNTLEPNREIRYAPNNGLPRVNTPYKPKSRSSTPNNNHDGIQNLLKAHSKKRSK